MYRRVGLFLLIREGSNFKNLKTLRFARRKLLIVNISTPLEKVRSESDIRYWTEGYVSIPKFVPHAKKAPREDVIINFVIDFPADSAQG